MFFFRNFIKLLVELFNALFRNSSCLLYLNKSCRYFCLRLLSFPPLLLFVLGSQCAPACRHFPCCHYNRLQITRHNTSHHNNNSCHAFATPAATAARPMSRIKTWIYWDKSISTTPKNLFNHNSSHQLHWSDLNIERVNSCAVDGSKELFKFIDRMFK